MLSNRRQNAVYRSTVVSAKAPLASVDICDIDANSDGDDDDKNDNHTNNNNNGLAASTTVAKEQWPHKPNASEQNVQDQSESDVLLTSSSSPSTNGYRRPRPSTINLQPIASAAKVNDIDITDGCFSGTSEDSEHGSSDQGINIQFCDIIYRARREISWDRCKCTHFMRRTEQNKQIMTEAIQFKCEPVCDISINF